MQDYRRLVVWQRAHQFVVSVYAATAAFPGEEKYGLTSQTRRSAVSIQANIAEGCGRETTMELRRFLYIAMGSASELDYHLLLARDLGFLEAASYQQLEKQAAEIGRMLTGLIRSLKND